MSVPLPKYVKMITTTWTVTPPGYPSMQRLVLTEEVQQLMRRILALMPDPLTNKMCLFELKADNVLVDPLTGRPFLHAVSWTANYDDKLAQMNYARVGEIFRETIFNGALASLPPDFQELLGLMKTMGHTASYVIQHHCSLVWAIDKKELFIRIYDYSHNILRKWPYTWYEEVMNNLVFPQHWDILIQENPYLDMFYKGCEYRPLGLNAGKEVLRFKRNTYSHCLEHAMDMTTMQQIYDQADLGEMMEAALPLVLHSFQVELDKRGLLRHIILESLFH
jgi:hypothetical protein